MNRSRVRMARYKSNEIQVKEVRVEAGLRRS
jgi:hypothetical protein